MYYKLQEDSVRVVNGDLYTSEGVLLYNPAIMVMGDVLIKAGNYSDLLKSLVNMKSSLLESGISTEDIYIIGFKGYFSDKVTIDDICYIIRRSIEFTGVGFVAEFMEKAKGEGFLDWLEVEKNLFPIQTRLE